MDRQVAAVQMVHAGALVRRPHQPLDAVAPANVRTQLDEGLPHIGVDGVGVEGVAGAFDGDGPVVILPAGCTPGAVALVHHGANAPIVSDTVVAAGPFGLPAELAAQGVNTHLPHYAVYGDGVDFVIARTIPVWTDYSHTA